MPAASAPTSNTLSAGWPPRWAVVSSVLLCLIGLALASYLTYAHYAEGNVLACPDTGAINCGKVTTSSQSKLLGIPVAVLGLAYFVALLGLCSPWAWRSQRPVVHLLRLGATLAGVAMVVYLIAAELFSIHAICLYCSGVHAATLLLFVVVMYADAERRVSQNVR